MEPAKWLHIVTDATADPGPVSRGRALVTELETASGADLTLVFGE